MADVYSERIMEYPRGSVWMTNFPDYDEDTECDGVTRGYRPALIISCDRLNSTSHSVVAVMLTSKAHKVKHFANIAIYNADGEPGCVLCNQVRTVAKKDLVKFKGIMPPAMMKKIEDKLAEVQCISRESVSMEEFESVVRNIINGYEEQTLVRRQHTNITQEQVNKIAAELESIFKDVLIPINREVVKDAPVLATFSGTYEKKANDGENVEEQAEERAEERAEKVLTTKQKKAAATKDSKAAKEDKPAKAKRKCKSKGFWTLERKKEFLKDCKEMSTDDVATKYELASKQSVWSTAYAFKKELREAEMKNDG